MYVTALCLFELYVLYSALVGASSGCSSANHFKEGAPWYYRTLPQTTQVAGLFLRLFLLFKPQFQHGSLRSLNQQRLLIQSERSILNTGQLFKYYTEDSWGYKEHFFWGHFFGTWVDCWLMDMSFEHLGFCLNSL